ncbi:MaoC/PaaZ C-terminal domain-containing protein [Haloechinothrix salitolerans]|uniref:MaoC/PaaZ C-terminal domain-containing protein n=1 Tax=Haloechinothrix salitolerans TaxID=926830 RepID=A0ABW2C0B1_9PSEU
MRRAELTVGAVLPELRVAPVSRTTLALFAGGSGDHNTVHIDIDAARRVGYHDVFAHGMLSMAYLGRMLTSWTTQDRIRSLRARFTAVTPVGASPVCTGIVTAINEHGGETTATITLEITLADGTTTVTGEAVVALN